MNLILLLFLALSFYNVEHFENGHIVDINDMNDLLVCDKGYSIIHDDDVIEITKDENYCFTKLSNNRIAIGLFNNNSPVYWSEETGIVELHKPNDRILYSIEVVGINSKNQIIGNYITKMGYKRSVIWDNEVATRFDADTLIAINENGSLIGMRDGVSFFWDGEFHAIPNLRLLDLNNSDQVLMQSENDCYFWSKEAGLQLICKDFKAISFNDHLQIVGDDKLYDNGNLIQFNLGQWTPKINFEGLILGNGSDSFLITTRN